MINNPYQTTPMMNNNYMPMQNPYADRMNFLQNYQQGLQQTTQPTQMSGANQQLQMQQVMPQQINFIGKIVDGKDTVKATDIPMDGNMYYFPKADGTEIYGKQWIVNECKTRILTYKPVNSAEPNDLSDTTIKSKFDLSDETTQLFLNKFEELSEKIGQLEDRFDKSLGTQRKTSRTQSKGGDEE